MRYYSLTFIVLVFAGLPAASKAFATEPSTSGRPNIVMILADDMAWDDCAAFGNSKIRTPHIDSLARDGMRFDQAFLTCSSCSPSRSSIITGRYPHSTDAEELHWPLPAEQVTFVEQLKANGYWTALAGKWHLGPAVKSRFDVVHEGGVSNFQLPSKKSKSQPRLKPQTKGESASGCGQWVSTLRERPQDRPFFLWLASFDPHRDYEPGTLASPHKPEDVSVPPFLPDTPEVRGDLAQYYDEITRLDQYVGAVLEELERQQVEKETIVLFLSDNGRPFPRCKTTLYDSGIKTPWLMRWPGHITPGMRCERLVSSVDIAPTFLALAKVTPRPGLQGRDFSPLLSTPGVKIRDVVFAEHNWHDYAADARAARTEKFKYIRNYDTKLPLTPPADAVRSPTFVAMRQLRDQKALTEAQNACFVKPRPEEELYDTEADPHELHNLINDPTQAKPLAALRKALADWEVETNDQRPRELSPDEFDRETGTPLPNRKRPRPSKQEKQAKTHAVPVKP